MCPTRAKHRSRQNIEAARIIAPRIMFLSMRYQVLIAVLGLVVAFVGLVAWSIEGEYGSGTDFLVQTHQGGPAIVYEVDEEKGTRTQVFEGPRREAQAYMERRRSEGENFLIPTLIIAAGAVLVVVALVPLGRPQKHA